MRAEGRQECRNKDRRTGLALERRRETRGQVLDASRVDASGFQRSAASRRISSFTRWRSFESTKHLGTGLPERRPARVLDFDDFRGERREDVNAVREKAGLFHRMRHKNDRRFFYFVDVSDQEIELFPCDDVEGRERLVEDEKLGLG